VARNYDAGAGSRKLDKPTCIGALPKVVPESVTRKQMKGYHYVQTKKL